MKRAVAALLRRYVPRLWYYIGYYRASWKLGDASGQRHQLFKQFVQDSSGRDYLQIGVFEGAKFAPHWVSVDLYDQSDYIDYNYDIHDLRFQDESFDGVACNAILEHIDDPATAIGELRRVLKPSGQIWVEVPFNQPYHESPRDLWRVSPEGLKIWMKGFTELASGFFRIHNSPIYTGVFFYGVKELVGPSDSSVPEVSN